MARGVSLQFGVGPAISRRLRWKAWVVGARSWATLLRLPKAVTQSENVLRQAVTDGVGEWDRVWGTGPFTPLTSLGWLAGFHGPARQQL